MSPGFLFLEMIAPAKKLLAVEVLGELEKFINTETVPTEFQLRKLKRDAAMAHHADHALAYMAEAGIAALTWDVEATRDLIRKALYLNQSATMLSNASITLKSIGLFEEACDHAVRAMRAEPADMLVLANAIECLGLVGKWTEAERLLREATDKGLKPAKPVLNFHGMNHFLEQAGIPLERLQAELRCVETVLREAKVRHRGEEIDLVKDPETGHVTLVHQTICFGTIEDELRLESRLGQLLDSMPGWNPETLCVEIACQREDAYQAA